MGYKLQREFSSGKKKSQESHKFSPKRHGSIAISEPSFPKERSVQQLPAASNSQLKEQIADKKLQTMLEDALSTKKAMKDALVDQMEQQLALEQARRAEMNKNFDE